MEYRRAAISLEAYEPQTHHPHEASSAQQTTDETKQCDSLKFVANLCGYISDRDICITALTA